MDLNDRPESIQRTITFAEDMTGHQQTASPALAAQQTVVDTPEDERQSYPTDLTDVRWQRIVPLLPPAELNGRLRSVELREVINGILYVVCGSHDWRSFPRDLPSRRTVYTYFRRWQLDGTLQRILTALCADEEVVGLEEAVVVASRDPVLGEPVSDGLVSVGDDMHNIAPLAEAQGTRVLYRHSNFFVLAPSYQHRQPAPRFAHQGVEADLDGRPAIDRETMERRRAIALDAHIRSERDRSATLLRASPWHVPLWLETILVIVALAASLAAHAYNMFNYPRYELDEGTYMSSAWAIMNGMITAYPYGYGHPPLAWIQIAGWVQLTGGFFTFGNALNSGRVLMLLFALGCSLLVYLIARQISNSRSIGLLAMVLFSLSPISLTYQRQVFLDNVGTFWLLLSLYLIIASKSRLSYIVLAAISFGIALLSKEVFLLFMPVLIYAAWLHSTRYQRKFTLIAFTYIVGACGLLFVLMAVLKGELFPYSWHLPWDHHPHLSMLDTIIQQAQRGQAQGKFADAWYEWTHADRPLMEVSLIAIAFNLLVGLWNHKHLFFLLPPFRFFKRWRVRDAVPVQDKHLLLSLLAISFWLLLVRGGVVLPFYIIPMIPLLVLNIVAAISLVVTLIGKLVRFKLVCVLLIFPLIGVIVPYDLQHAQIAFTLHPTTAQTNAMVWVRNHVPRSAMIVSNSYLYMDLREPVGQGAGGGASYPYAHIYWNVAYDPELHDLLLQGNWDRIDYIVADSEMLHDIETNGGPMMLIYTALQHSVLRAEFRANDTHNQIVISVYQVMHKQASPILSHIPGGASPTFIDRRWATTT
jgi:transposase/4-amino-4-deoxy-L-arabinose transferase-like glycosyltransferase